MKPRTFFDHFERLTDAPNAVARLRELVLQLAVQGKLVPQDPNDEPADKLLAAIMAQRQRKALEEGGKTQQALPPVSSDEVPYGLPPGWSWERLGNLGDTNIGLTYSPSDVNDTGVPVLRSNNIQNGKIDLSDLVRVATVPKRSVLVEIGDLLICARNGSRALVGKTALIEHLSETTAFGAFMAVFRSSMNQYLYHFICSPLFRQMIDEVNTTTINQITQTNLRSTIAPVPPLAEQKRIVTKVDELMRLCDDLERAQAERREARQHLSRAALDQLLTARDAAEFQACWQVVSDHFPTLTATPDQISKLRQTVLQLAVQGKLTQQDPQDEPAPALLRRIRAERERLVKEKRLKRAVPLPPIGPDETPFVPPSGWTWARFGEVATIASNLVRPDAYPDHLHVAPDNIEKQTGRLLACRTVREDEVRSANHLFYSGQIVYSKIRPNLAKATIVDFDGLCSADMYPINAHIDANFLLKYMLSSTFLSMAVKSDTRVAMPKINQDELNKILVAVPPLEEQKRIVAVVNHLMALRDELEAGLRRAEEDSERLLRAAVRSLLAPAPENSVEVAALAVQ